MIPLADKRRDQTRTEQKQAECDLLSNVWDTVMGFRIETRDHVVDFHGMRIFADSSDGVYPPHYYVRRIKEGYEHVPIWSVGWSRYSFSFEGSFEQYEKDLAILKMFVA